MKENISVFYGNEFGIIILVLFASIFIFSIIYVKKFRKNQLLKAHNVYLKNEIREFQNSIIDKDIQLKEIHHRIKNNLQLISSLLNIQGRNNSNNFKDFLEKGQSQILSISLLHQNLYESEHTNKVSFQEYAQSLVNSIFAVYVKNTNIKIEVNANNNFLDSDTAIPLGLIITELVCNAFKHAFVNKNDGIISIELLSSDAINFELYIKDNGIGFQKISSSDKSLGLELVSLLVLQLNGKLNRCNQNGTLYSIRFKNKQHNFKNIIP